MEQNDMQVGNVTLNLKFYTGNDQYSDGDVENDILEIVKSCEDYDKKIDETDRFEVFYHLSKEREMIVQIMNIASNDTILEIGAGCGAITGALAAKGKSVECIELSYRRSLINAYRHQNCSNIVIDVGNYEDIPLNKQYNVVTLIGVLEYAGYYIHSKNPYEAFLLDIKKRMTGDGTLYIAIENRLGIKYFAGCKEDHLGKEFAGIEGYAPDSKVRTFSFYELTDLFEKCGFREYKFYYPYPDYKFAHAVYSDEWLPQKGDFNEIGTNYTSSRRKVFDEIKFLDNLVLGEEFKLFANSYVIALKK